METSVSHPCAIASATRYSSFRILLPPKASPLLQSSRFAHTRAPPRWALRRSSGCTGDGPKRKGYRANEPSFMRAPCRRRRPGAGRVAASWRALLRVLEGVEPDLVPLLPSPRPELDRKGLD